MNVMRWLRELHIAAGLFCLPLAVVYALSALQMGHPKFPGPVLRDVRTPTNFGAAVTPDDVAARLASPMASSAPRALAAGGDTIAYRVERLLRNTELRISASTGAGWQLERRGNLMALLNRLHHTAGLPARGWAGWWGVLALAASIGMILLGLGGIILWWPRVAERRLGLWVMILSTSASLGLLLWIRTRG